MRHREWAVLRLGPSNGLGRRRACCRHSRWRRNASRLRLGASRRRSSAHSTLRSLAGGICRRRLGGDDAIDHARQRLTSNAAIGDQRLRQFCEPCRRDAQIDLHGPMQCNRRAEASVERRPPIGRRTTTGLPHFLEEADQPRSVSIGRTARRCDASQAAAVRLLQLLQPAA